MTRIAAALILILMIAAPTAADDWPGWRGPNADGVSKETDWRAAWTDATPKVLWQRVIGPGYSGVAVVAGRLYTLSSTGRRRETETVLCLDATTGTELWRHAYALTVRRGGTPVASTPTVRGGRVYTFGAAADLVCLDAMTGKALWRKTLTRDLDARPVAYGYCASPLVTDDAVIVPVFPTRRDADARMRTREPGGGAYPPKGGVLVAFDANTGTEKWRQSAGANAWSTPVAATIDGKKTIIHDTGSMLLGVRPADGKLLWKYTPDVVRDLPWYPRAAASTPAVVDDRVIYPSKLSNAVLCVKITAAVPRLLWKGPMQNWYHSTVVSGAHVYIPHGGNRVSCLDLGTGRKLWDLGSTEELPFAQTRHSGRGGDHGGGFIIANGKILLSDHLGQLIIADASPRAPRVLAKLKVLTRDRAPYRFETAPVLSGGLLYCRSARGQLVCLDLRKQ